MAVSRDLIDDCNGATIATSSAEMLTLVHPRPRPMTADATTTLPVPVRDDRDRGGHGSPP